MLQKFVESPSWVIFKDSLDKQLKWCTVQWEPPWTALLPKLLSFHQYSYRIHTTLPHMAKNSTKQFIFNGLHSTKKLEMQKAEKCSLEKIQNPSVAARSSGTAFLCTQIHSSIGMTAVLFSPSRPSLKQELQSLLFQTGCTSHIYHTFITSFSTGLSQPDSGSR